ncbi:DNA-3-methyladenine glycosylase [Cellulosilyticum ruminicola]|uniref:hypothetical protein n=1 Tax=Cellulosilyticum ruminicola TaxID=425254 RepID=UPI0038BB49F5
MFKNTELRKSISKLLYKILPKIILQQVFNQISGFNPWPVAYTVLEDKEIKIYEASIGEETYNTYVNIL